MSRSLHRGSDLITRDECVALINHALNRLIRQATAEPAPYQDVSPALTEGAVSCQTVPPHTLTLGTPCA